MFKGMITIAIVSSTLWFGGLKEQIEPYQAPTKNTAVSQVFDKVSEGQKGLDNILGSSENQAHLRDGLSGNIDPSR